MCLDFIWLSDFSLVASTRSFTVNCINLLVLCAPTAAAQPPSSPWYRYFSSPATEAINLCMFRALLPSASHNAVRRCTVSPQLLSAHLRPLPLLLLLLPHKLISCEVPEHLPWIWMNQGGKNASITWPNCTIYDHFVVAVGILLSWQLPPPPHSFFSSSASSPTFFFLFLPSLLWLG